MTTEHKVICPVCGAYMDLRETKKYKYKNGGNRLFYGCSRWPDCNGTHGAHPDGSPLGTPADQETKEWRRKAHDAMDDWMDRNNFNRSQGYANLKQAFGTEVHMGELDIKGCQEVIKYFDEN